MVAMGVVQVAIDQVVDVVTVGHGFVAAARTVNVAWLMAGAAVRGSASGGIGGAHWDGMLVHMVAVGVVQVAIVQIVDVAVVHDGGVAAARTVLVVVVGVVMGGTVAHGVYSFR